MIGVVCLGRPGSVAVRGTTTIGTYEHPTGTTTIQPIRTTITGFGVFYRFHNVYGARIYNIKLL